MSLDVSLYEPSAPKAENASGIFIRDNGQNREISREEWNEKFPGREPVIAQSDPEIDCVFSRNITHNLTKMADEAGIYKALWRPEELGITKAHQLIEPLTNGLIKLEGDPDWFAQFNPSSGWGNYDGLVEFVKTYLKACEQYPNADVEISR